MEKIFRVADIHKLLNSVWKEEITYSRMVEIMNEMCEKHDNSKWISVKDKLPENERKVLCFHESSGNYFICYYTRDCNTNEPKWFGGAMPDFWRDLKEPTK